MLNREIVNRIRHIFLHPRPHVSMTTAAALLGWSHLQMRKAIARGEIDVMTTPLATWVWREELMSKALELWNLDVIEAALGDDAAGVLPAAIRTCELRARVPRYQAAMLEHMAQQEATTVSAILTRELEDVASAHLEELSSAISGFAAALEWPAVSDRDHIC